MSTAVVLEAQQLHIGYGSTVIGQHINFALYAGETLCLLGPNGSGKSTLFKTLLGLLPALAGEVYLGSRSITSYSRKQVAQRIAYVPQLTAEVFAFKVVDMVLMGRSAYMGLFATPAPADYELALHSLARLGIDHLASRHYNELSGGEQQLVLLARALVQAPQILVLDEPTASLDFGNQLRVLDQIAALKAQGLAIFLCTHQPEHAYRVADRVMLFRAGEVMALGDTATTLRIDALANLYDLPEYIVRQHLATQMR